MLATYGKFKLSPKIAYQYRVFIDSSFFSPSDRQKNELPCQPWVRGQIGNACLSGVLHISILQEGFFLHRES